jgi:hypothetical protein
VGDEHAVVVEPAEQPTALEARYGVSAMSRVHGVEPLRTDVGVLATVRLGMS